MPLDLGGKILSEDMQTIFSSRKDWNEFKNSKVFISGATGMLASYLVLYFIWLNERKKFGISIFLGVRSEQKARSRFGCYLDRPYIKLVVGDISENLLLPDNLDYIIHAASLASPQFYGGMPVETMLPNIIGTNNLLVYAKTHKLRSFLFFSSGAVYGKFDNVSKYSEDMNGDFAFADAGNVYGESKRCGEALCDAYFREYSVPVRAVRIYHTYAPTMDLQNDKRAFSEFVNNILHNQNIVLKSAGLDKRPFCYITDGISAILKVLLDGQSGEAYNLANNNQFVSMRQLAETLVGLYPEKGLKVVYGQRVDKGYLNLSVSNDMTCDTSKIERLGCTFKVTIAEGFKRVIEYNRI